MRSSVSVVPGAGTVSLGGGEVVRLARDLTIGFDRLVNWTIRRSGARRKRGDRMAENRWRRNADGVKRLSPLHPINLALALSMAICWRSPRDTHSRIAPSAPPPWEDHTCRCTGYPGAASRNADGTTRPDRTPAVTRPASR